jgi:hypothetical protein
MDKKKIFIIGGVVLALGVGFYFWNKSKNATDSGGADGSAETPADATKSAETPAESPADATATTKAPLTKRKDKRKACGRKPLNKKKEKYTEWKACVDAGGVASFEGSDFDQWENDYMDFSGLNLDL